MFPIKIFFWQGNCVKQMSIYHSNVVKIGDGYIEAKSVRLLSFHLWSENFKQAHREYMTQTLL